MKIIDLINYGIEELNRKNIDDATFKARILGEKILNLDKVQMMVKKDGKVDIKCEIEYKKQIDRITLGYPIQYITNEQYFYKNKFYVDESVLIPQPDTEVLVEEVLKIVDKFYKDKEVKILDICTGSGCIGITLKKNLKNADVTLSDISCKALEIASKNAKENEVEVKIIESNMFQNIKDKYDIIVSNPPYIETDTIGTLSKEVQNEPHLALDGGKDGLDFYKILTDTAYKYLYDDGFLCMEIGYNQKENVTNMINKLNKYIDTYSKKDLSGNDRIIITKKE